MTETILAMVPDYGAAALFVIAAIACLGVPIPASLPLLMSGSFVASGELTLVTVLAAGVAGAVLGDQLGYLVGSLGGDRAVAWLSRRRTLAAALTRARSFSERWGTAGVFFTRWLVSPLGPAMNLLSGLVRMPWRWFTLAVVLGEVVWVGMYVALGYVFSRSIVGIADVLGDLAWFLASGVVAVLLVWRGRSILVARAAAHRGATSLPVS